MSEVFVPTDQSFTSRSGSEPFIERRREMADILKQCFAGYPWYEDLTDEEAQSRIDSHTTKPGFDAILLEGDDGPVGAIWYDTPTSEELESERGAELIEFVVSLGEQHDVDRVVWVRESAVRPELQGQGLATRLRKEFLDRLASDGVGNTLILTRMRSDNYPILAIARKFDYQPTGIQMSSSQSPDAFHEYWYKYLESEA